MEDALNKLQIAFDNDVEVYASRIDQCESALDQTARHYQGMLNLTASLDEEAERHAEAKAALADLLGQLDRAHSVVSKFEALGREIAEYTQELDVKTQRLRSNANSK